MAYQRVDKSPGANTSTVWVTIDSIVFHGTAAIVGWWRPFQGDRGLRACDICSEVHRSREPTRKDGHLIACLSASPIEVDCEDPKDIRFSCDHTKMRVTERIRIIAGIVDVNPLVCDWIYHLNYIAKDW